MRVLVVGNGGREDALCKKLHESPLCEKLYCCPGNGGTARYGENLSLRSNEEIVSFAKENIDFVVVGPEKPLCEGLVDELERAGVKAFGPKKKAAQLEGSKDFTKRFLEKYALPTARYKTVYSFEEAVEALQDFSYPLVIKADGLCAGKGVGIFQELAQAKQYLEELFVKKIFGEEAKKVVIEEFLDGKEASLLCVVSGNQLFPLESARDYKRIYDGDLGDNTGGVGCYSPNELFTAELKGKIGKVLEKISHGLKQEDLEYSGILFIGFMIIRGEPKILEFNVRFGDPETEVILPRLQSDLLLLMDKAVSHSLREEDFQWSEKTCMTVVMTSKGYPHAYEKHKRITGEITDPSVFVYHNNTVLEEGVAYSDGGRVLSVTTMGDSLSACREKIYAHIGEIHFEGACYRKDIGIPVE